MLGGFDYNKKIIGTLSFGYPEFLWSQILLEKKDKKSNQRFFFLNLSDVIRWLCTLLRELLPSTEMIESYVEKI